MMLKIYYQGNNPRTKYYEDFKDWDKTSLEIIEDTLRRGKEKDFKVDFVNFDAYKDIIVEDGVYSKEQYHIELSENLTCDEINKVMEKYFKVN